MWFMFHLIHSFRKNAMIQSQLLETSSGCYGTFHIFNGLDIAYHGNCIS